MKRLSIDPQTAQALRALLVARGSFATVLQTTNALVASLRYHRDEHAFVEGFLAGMQHVAEAL